MPRGAALCPACDREIERPAPGACCLCQDASAAAPGGRCGACAEARSELEACLAAAWFSGAAARWVKRFKYAAAGLHGLDPAAEAVAFALVGEALARMPAHPPDALVAVPLHPLRLRRRGHAPASILAAAAGRALGVPVLPGALLRTRDTPSQTARGRGERVRNVAGCFAAPAGAAPQSVWLVDDVVTTGATLGEAARTLRRAGTSRIAALCLARTPAPAR